MAEEVDLIKGTLESTTDGQGADILGYDNATYPTVGLALNASLMPAQTTQGVIELPLGAFTLDDGTALAAYAAAPTPGWALTNAKAYGIYWGTHATPTPIGTTVYIPQELDPTANATLNILCSKVGATLADATTFTITAFNQVNGALHDADADYGGASSAIVGDAATKTLQKSTRTLALANLPDPQTANCTVSITLQPTDGTLGTDDIIVHRVWITYTRKPLTS
jgi:hypothetical protein